MIHNVTSWICFAALATGWIACVALAGCGKTTPSRAGEVASQLVTEPERATPPPADESPQEAPAAASDTAAEEPESFPAKLAAPESTPAAAEPAPSPPKAAAPSRPPADRVAAKPGEAEKITFDDLNVGMQADVVFRPFMLTDRVKELDKKKVSISGYMYGGVSATRGIKEFVLLRNTECKFGPGGQADHLAQVYLQTGVTTNFTPSPIKVEGTLVLQPFEGPDGNTWSIYRLEDARIP